MSGNVSTEIRFPAQRIDAEIVDCLSQDGVTFPAEIVDCLSQDGVTFPAPNAPISRWMDDEVEINDGIFRLSAITKYGEFNDLEALLIEKGIPFDRENGRDYDVEPQLRVFRPGEGDRFYSLGDAGEIMVPLEDVRRALENNNIHEFLAEKYPEYKPITGESVFLNLWYPLGEKNVG